MFKHMALSFPRQSMTDLNIQLARGSAKKTNTFEALDAALLLRHMALAARGSKRRLVHHLPVPCSHLLTGEPSFPSQGPFLTISLRLCLPFCFACLLPTPA
jgi:hypothetical protein